MALNWIEGWETHTGTAQLDRKYATRTGSIVVQSGRVFGNSAGILSLVAVTPKGDEVLEIVETYAVEVEGQDRPACVAETIMRLYF